MNYKIICYSGTNTIYKDFYKDHNIKVVLYQPKNDGYISSRLFRKFFNNMSYLWEIVTAKDSRHASVIHIQSVIIKRVFYSKCLRFINRDAKIVWSFWGSDIFRASKKQLFLLKHLVQPSVVFTAASMSLVDRIHEIFPRNSFRSPCRYLDFGNSAFPHILACKQHPVPGGFRSEFSIPEDKIAIAVGYNQGPAQQHTSVVRALARLPQEQKDRCVLFLHWGYGVRDESYVAAVHEALTEAGIPYRIYEEYLTPQKIARLRCSIDIYINAQTTDAMSSSVLEYLLAGTQLVSGAWLKYPELAEWGVPYETFDDFLALTEVMTRVLTDFHRSVGQAHAFDERLYHAKAWETLSKEWREVIAPQGRQE